jgi:hypothetical protein
MVYYGEASAYDNIVNIGDEYIENMRRSMTDHEFRISILNEDPLRVEKTFYPAKNERHLYLNDYDDDVTQPHIVALDYQASILPIVACQFSNKVNGKRTLNFLQSHYVLYPKGLKDAVDLYCKHNEKRLCKEVVYLYDHTAKAKDPARLAYWQEVVEAFKKNGWKITPIYMGQTPRHEDKYRSITKAFDEQNPETPAIRIHKERCVHMLISMDLAGLKNSQGIEKDKSSEKRDDYPQEQATHFSDVFDQLVWGLLEMKLYNGSPRSGGDVAMIRG